MTDPTLFKPGPALGAMKEREYAAYLFLQSRPLGVTSTELGVHIHTTVGVPCACSPSTICRWAHGDGETAGKQLRKRGVAFKKAHLRWTLLPAARPRDTGTFPSDY